MIAHIRGTILEKHPNQVIVEAGGVGYDVTVPISTYTALPGEGSEVRLRIHTHVREDALALYGFLSREEKILFEKLIGVGGIGPKLGITVLSGLAVEELIASIRQGLVENLVRIPGVGKKTAERIVLELRDKLDHLGAGAALAVPPASAFSALEQDVLSALLNLGCARPAAEAAVRKARTPAPAGGFEPFFRRALELMR
jgi:Holliday junction DNA helicase RuvA